MYLRQLMRFWQKCRYIIIMRKLLFFILILYLFAACKSPPPPLPLPQIIEEPVIVVKDPLFEIVSIVILQAELINTQFETVLRIDNPNDFPVELSRIKYELYGNGMFWADGMENAVLQIPAKSRKDTKFRFSMNFINMNRKLLDDIIAMRNVQYVFKGEAGMRANYAKLPVSIMKFNCSGLSEVKPKAEN
jgi:LEA14-like dessication related protein